MRITVFGASGRIGRHVVAKALGHGHEVTAFVHETPLAPTAGSVRQVVGDIRDLDAVREAVHGNSGVVFALSRGSGGAHVHEAGIANVIFAMAEDMAPKLAVVSAAGTFARSDHHLSLGYRALLATSMRGAYNDLEAMERRVMASDLDWTIVRPFALSDDAATGHYRLSLDGSILRDSKRITRADVASLLVKALETDTYWRRTVVISG